jgi:PKD repeat protein
VSVAVYRGTDTARPLSASLLHNSASAEHATPTVDVPAGGGWLVSHWAEKSSTATSWQLPAGQTRRAASSTAASSGRVLSVLADTGGTVPSGTQGNMVATADAAGRGITATVLLRAGDAAAPTNRAPVARAADPVCSDLRCTFDGSGSEDPDGDDLTYDWDFGDGSAPGSGPTAAHTYAAAVSRTVTLTVTDPSGASDTAVVTARPSEASPTGEVTHVASAATGGNRVNHAVAVPPAVQAGDRLVLVLTGNTTSPSYTGPSGWDPVVSRDGRGIALRAWTRVADDETAGSVSVTSSGYAKSTVTITAYRSSGGTPSIAAVEAAIDDAPGAEHTSPEVDVPANGGWLVSYWADKSSDTDGWDTPAQATVRSTATSGGTGHVTSVLADSGAARPAGPAGGLTATANSTSSRGASLSLVLVP